MARKKLYVAYGSNLHLGQMAHRCPDAKIYGAGVIKNYKLTFWGSGTRGGVATVLPNPGTDVPVGIWEISAQDEVNLDYYEGFPSLYRKEKIKVKLDDGRTVTGMIYIMNRGILSNPSEYYYNVIETGYNSFGFNTDFLKAAAADVAAAVSKNHKYEFAHFFK